MQEDKITDRLIQQLTLQIGILTAEKIELNLIIDDLKEQLLSAKMNRDIDQIKELNKEDSPNE
nr:MAG TPA: hypothetical protein [Caudoviricetes sp.]